MPFGVKPQGAAFYAVDTEHRFEMIAWSPPPQTGDAACIGLTGRTESQLVRDILDGKYAHLLDQSGEAQAQTKGV